MTTKIEALEAALRKLVSAQALLRQATSNSGSPSLRKAVDTINEAVDGIEAAANGLIMQGEGRLEPPPPHDVGDLQDAMRDGNLGDALIRFVIAVNSKRVVEILKDRGFITDPLVNEKFLDAVGSQLSDAVEVIKDAVALVADMRAAVLPRAAGITR